MTGKPLHHHVGVFPFIDGSSETMYNLGDENRMWGVAVEPRGANHMVVEIEQELRQIAGIVRRRGRSMLEEFGITPPQFDALVILDRSGNLTIGELSARLFLAYSTTTDLVDRLERAGFVVRARDSADRRVVLVKLQETGQEVIERVLDARRAYLGVVLESFDESERSQILKVLEALHERMNGNE